jgi:hypothetical protein
VTRSYAPTDKSSPSPFPSKIVRQKVKPTGSVNLSPASS